MFLISPPIQIYSALFCFSLWSSFFFLLLFFYSYHFNSHIENLLLPFHLFFILILSVILLIGFYFWIFYVFFLFHPSTFYFLGIGFMMFSCIMLPIWWLGSRVWKINRSWYFFFLFFSDIIIRYFFLKKYLVLHVNPTLSGTIFF